MRPILVTLAPIPPESERVVGILIGFGQDEDAHPVGFVVVEGGSIEVEHVEDIHVERPNQDFPIGHGFFSAIEVRETVTS